MPQSAKIEVLVAGDQVLAILLADSVAGVGNLLSAPGEKRPLLAAFGQQTFGKAMPRTIFYQAQRFGFQRVAAYVFVIDPQFVAQGTQFIEVEVLA